MPYKQIFFDLDHTLWDFEANSKESLQDMFIEFALAEKGIPDFSSFHLKYASHNDKMWERYRKGYITREELRWKRVSHTLLDFKIGDQRLVQDISLRYLEVLPTKTHLFPGTTEVLDYLKAKNYPLHLITNGFEKTQRLKLGHSGIDHYFTFIVTSESTGSLKPQREIFDHALRQSGCRASEAIMIGDALDVDILGARGAGIDQVYFNPAKPAAGIQPTYSIQTLEELTDIL
ncbi:MAG TPA: YjjG family noncanonical pyrimidine nucleotidase [Chitinophagaceae bacterium]|jgi:putative hydrolase of the HAD superfamily|nr:YjjG family noncanonical pyrimidine nucleotidase [Chitinophagaceae bacterium]